MPAPPPWPPVPPIEMPPARTLRIADRGELFMRDTGGGGPVVLLLHGWLASADLNWLGAYGALTEAGYRVLAIDHRGHGRGIRSLAPFRLADCAGDAAAALRTLEAAPAIVVGYSMGGAIAQLIARDHPDVLAGLVLSGTAQHWKDREAQRMFRQMAAFGLVLSLAPEATWRWGFRRVGLRPSAQTVWVQSELMRHSSRDVAEAGRELGRFDSRPWLRPPAVPTAVVLTSRDQAVAPRKQRELAAAVRARVFEASIDHLQIITRARHYTPALLDAMAAVRDAGGVGIEQRA